jgi:hypothetical protein
MSLELGANMSLYDELIAAIPELKSEDFDPYTGTIALRDDSDGQGAYIEKWEYSKPIPKGFKLGK